MRKTIQNRLSVTGPVSGTDSVDVVSNLHAEILEIPVKEGDKVTKGQTLAVLDDSDVRKTTDIAKNDYDLAVSTCAEKDKEARNGYAKAIQDLNTAQANYDRTKALYDGGSVPKVDLETAENGLNDAKRERDSYTVKNGTAVADDSYRLQIEKAKYDYEKATESLEDTVLKAPIDGTVVRVNTKVGRFADKMENDAPLFVIENLDQLELEIKVSEYSIGKVALGQEAEISADILNGGTVHGVVDSISPTGEEKGGGSTEPDHGQRYEADRRDHRPRFDRAGGIRKRPDSPCVGSHGERRDSLCPGAHGRGRLLGSSHHRRGRRCGGGDHPSGGPCAGRKFASDRGAGRAVSGRNGCQFSGKTGGIRDV